MQTRDPLERVFVISGIIFIWALILLLFAGVYDHFKRASWYSTKQRSADQVSEGWRTAIIHNEKTSKRYVIKQQLDGTPIETTSVTDWKFPDGR